MQKIFYITFVLILLYACKTIEENSYYNATSLERGGAKKVWENALDLTNANLDSLAELYGHSVERFEEARQKGMRYVTEYDMFLKYSPETKTGQFLKYDNSITIYPNPTSSSVVVEIIKSIRIKDKTGYIPYPGDLSWCFPFDLTMKLILDEKIVWTYRNPICMGTEIINESVLQKPGNYLLVVEIDGYNASKNFMVIKKQ